jgi:hypothetical protein
VRQIEKDIRKYNLKTNLYTYYTMNRIINHKHYEPRRLNANYEGNHYYTHNWTVKEKDGVGIDVDVADAFVEGLIGDKIGKNGNLYQVVYQTIEGGWVFSTFGDDELTPDFERYGLDANSYTIVGISINHIKKPKEAGGFDDIHNDCLYYAIKHCLADKADRFLPKFALQFKKWVNVARDDPIHYQSIPKIEDKIKCRINVVGDYEYNSAKPYSRVVVVTLKDAHYRYKNNMAIRRHLVKFRNFKQHLVFYEFVADTVKQQIPLIRFYDGVTVVEKRIKRQELVKTKDTFNFENPKGDIQANYHKFIQDCEHFNELTGISLADYNYCITDCCLSLFYKYAKCYEFETMDDHEKSWIKRTKRGGLMYADPCVGSMNSYDINSCYPSIMVDTKSQFPYTSPEYSIISEKPEFGWTLGIYRAIISNIDDKLFSDNKFNYYTSIDMKRAEELGFSIQLIQDGQHNACLYRKHITGKDLFEGYINEMFQHKNTINKETGKKNPLFKQMMNNLHGLLAERKKRFHTDKNGDFQTDHPLFCSVEIFERGGDTEIMSKGNFIRPQARTAPFITAYARTKISKVIEPIKDEVYRIQTDGFFTTADNLVVDDTLGGLKLEYSGEYDIIHVNRIVCVNCSKTAKECDKLGCSCSPVL